MNETAEESKHMGKEGKKSENWEGSNLGVKRKKENRLEEI